MAMANNQPRFSNIDKDSWSMILGRAGKLPGKLAPEIVELAKKHGYEFFDGNPQDAYPDALPQYIAEMEQNGWECGEDDEELFELAMHDRQYRDYKSGIAKERFNKEIAQLRAKAAAPAAATSATEATNTPNYITQQHPDATPIVAAATGQLLWQIDFDDRSIPPAPGRQYKRGDTFCVIQSSYALMPTLVEKDGSLIDTCVRQGQMVKKGDVIGWMK